MAEDVWQNPRVSELFLKSLRHLQVIVEEAHDLHDEDAEDVTKIETVFPYRHANNLCWLAEDLLLLIEDERIASTAVIARAMLESFFYLAACNSVPNFAARKSIWEMREFLRRSRKLVESPSDNWLVAETAEIQQFIERIERHYGMAANEPAWTIARCIDECGDVAYLRLNYFFLSLHTHSTFMGLTAQHEGRHAWLIQQSVLGCLTIGAAIAPQVIPTHSAQQHVDKATELLGELLELIKDGTLAHHEE